LRSKNSQGWKSSAAKSALTNRVIKATLFWFSWPHMKVIHKNNNWMSPETLNPDGTGYYKVRRDHPLKFNHTLIGVAPPDLK
jgi:hypothetical protein